MTEIVVASLLSNLDRSHTKCNAPSICLEQTLVCRVEVQLIFKNVSRNKKVYAKCKSEKTNKSDLAARNMSRNRASF